MPPPNKNSNKTHFNNRQNFESTASCQSFQGTMLNIKENKSNLKKDPINQNYPHHNNVTTSHFEEMKLESKWNLFGSSENDCTEPSMTENENVNLSQVNNQSHIPVSALYTNSYSNCNNNPTQNNFETKVKRKTQIQPISTVDNSFTKKVTPEIDESLDVLDTNVSRKPMSASSSHTSNKWGKYVIEDTTEEVDQSDDEDEGEMFVSAEDLKDFMN